MGRGSIGLTDAKLKAMKPPASGQVEISDQVVPGLRVRMGVSGAQTFVVRKRIGGKPRNITVGRYSPRFAVTSLVSVTPCEGAVAGDPLRFPCERLTGAVVAYLRQLAHENGLPLACVRRPARRARGFRGACPDLRRAPGSVSGEKLVASGFGPI
ncbi:MAG: Arm DNA-binding domain-containing protein [Pseudomonadota bacterium]|jgi:hypothetical protein